MINLLLLLSVIPTDDWYRNWTASKTFILRRTSKEIKKAIDKIRPPAQVNINTPEKLLCFLKEFLHINTYCRIIELNCKALIKITEDLSHFQDLKILTLSDNYLFGPDGAESLAGILPNLKALEKLNLERNNIGPVGATSLAGALVQSPSDNLTVESALGLTVQCPSLTCLNLSKNRIKDEGFESIAVALQQCSKLTSLNLSDNRITKTKMLIHCTSLTVLNLSKNKIIKLKIDKYSLLTRLDLSWNFIKMNRGLFKVLLKCPLLTHLDLSWNWIKYDGIISLVGMLLHYSELANINIDLRENQVDNAELDMLREIKKQCPILSRLLLD
jgi:Ran GTPase-activating protein (RanGAP) involved in mRNA processing and transport